MANGEHVALLKQGVDVWNTWRQENPDASPDLSGVDLNGLDLSGADLHGANLTPDVQFDSQPMPIPLPHKTNLSGASLINADLRGAGLWSADLSKAKLNEADLYGANLVGADLREADLRGANLLRADLSNAILVKAKLNAADLNRAQLYMAILAEADLSEADLYGANLNGADLTGADLREANLCTAALVGATLTGAKLQGADLTYAILTQADLTDADLTGCRVYGVSAWGLRNVEKAKQQNLVITYEGEPEVTVDRIEVAQFVYLLLNNPKIRDVIDTIGKKGVLLLGRFTEGRLEILERLRAKLRDLGFVPMVFNFDKPEAKNFTETVRLLANLSHFVIVDITNPRSTPLELQATVPDYMVPFVPILQEGEDPFAMFVDLQNQYDWVLEPVIVYPSVDRLIAVLEDKIVKRAETKFNELLERRAKKLQVEMA